MNYNYLRYFSVLAELEHYTLAAARLGLSQPSLSSAIRHLENELGVTLFEKVGRNIRLTKEGRFFQRTVNSVLAELNSATQTLMASRESAPIVLRVGFISGTLNGTAATEIARYLRQEKRTRFHLVEDSAENLLNLVRQEKLDMAIVDEASRDRSLHFRKLGEQDFYAVVPKGHPLDGMASVSHQAVSQYPQIFFHFNMEESFSDWASHGHAADSIVCQVNTAATALELVAAGAGVAVLPETCALPREDITYIPLENRHQALYMCILYDKWLDPPVWEFVEQLVKALRGR